MAKVLALFVDGLSSRYLKEISPPFISQLANDAFLSEVDPLFAYLGVGTTIFTGVEPSKSGVFWDYVRQSPSEIPLTSRLVAYLTEFIPSDRLAKDCRYVANRLLGHPPLTPNLIPAKLLGEFRPTVSGRLYESTRIAGSPTLFGILKGHRLRYACVNLYGEMSDRKAVKTAHDAIALGDNDLVCVKVAGLDSLGHSYGPGSQNVRKYLLRLDRWLGSLVCAADRSEAWELMLFSDHGMTPVSQYVNILKELSRRDLHMPGDFLAFLDSTVARFWLKNESKRQAVENALSDLKSGKVITPAEIKELGLDRVQPDVGEIFFALEEGAVVFPNFFQRRVRPRGMHGYHASCYDRAILILRSAKGIAFPHQRPSFADILPTTLALLGLRTTPGPYDIGIGGGR